MNTKKTGKNIITGMTIGLLLGAVTTVLVANNKSMNKKVRNTTEAVTDSFMNMMR